MNVRDLEAIQISWKALRKKDKKTARQQIRKAHDELQDHIVFHPICHMMMAMTYTKEPIQMTKEMYLGIMAPWASLRRNRSTKKRRRFFSKT